MERSLLSLLILFASICQIYIYRLYRDFDDLKDPTPIHNSHPYISIYKTIQIVGICVSLYLRLLSGPQEELENMATLEC